MQITQQMFACNNQYHYIHVMPNLFGLYFKKVVGYLLYVTTKRCFFCRTLLMNTSCFWSLQTASVSAAALLIEPHITRTTGL